MEFTEDIGGKAQVKLFDYDNYRFAAAIFYDGFKLENVAEHLQALKHMETRDDDVLIMTYPKSG